MTGIIVHDMEDGMEITDSSNLMTENDSQNNLIADSNNGLQAGAIAGIVVGVVAAVAVLGMIGYKLTQKPTITVSDNSYSSM
jgi:hypothetical protein